MLASFELRIVGSQRQKPTDLGSCLGPRPSNAFGKTPFRDCPVFTGEEIWKLD